MLGVLVNTAAVLIGSCLGLLLNKIIPQKITKAIITALGLCTLYIGISGALEGENVLVLILSMCIGTAAGSALDIDGGLNKAALFAEKKYKKNSGVSIAEGFVTASLLFCVGAMTIVGSLRSGLTGDNTMIYTKSTLDLFSSFALAATLGAGVVFAAIFVFIFQGSIVLLAQYLSPFLSEAVTAEITCVGSIIILAIGMNLILNSKIKTADMLPAVVLPIVLVPLYNFASGIL